MVEVNLEYNITFEKRKELEIKLAEVFKENIKELRTELQKILLDDLVTAFQNRMNVLILAQEKGNY